MRKQRKPRESLQFNMYLVLEVEGSVESLSCQVTIAEIPAGDKQQSLGKWMCVGCGKEGFPPNMDELCSGVGAGTRGSCADEATGNSS